MTAADVPAHYREADRAARIILIAESYQRLLGRDLVPAEADMISALWHAPLAVVAHGTEADPVFFFGNRAALAAFDSTPEDFAMMPSRLSAEAPLRDERQALLDRVTQHGFIDDYAGIRISAKGRRFAISGAAGWNLIDGQGMHRGQAAAVAAP